MRKYLEKVKNKNDFERVYKDGKNILSEDKKLRARVIVSPLSKDSLLRYGISVMSKKGNSVWRNRFKRVIRELVNNESIILQQTIRENEINIEVIFSPYSLSQNNYRKIFYKDIVRAFQDILNKIKLTLILTTRT